ncbi:telomere length regulation protein-domain-containing protein [Gilbertella persicaria]|uniref:telomere length regulation protein-domain-containing protein n=1 Tax=Gilbertella persicaria TaxID=101096 RepID=UPI00222061DB|nr:telomere length regulation protein-domain-containing protein [Gilbertella persicaria]KAI8098324.1 telomere length regulation protein-domain-containing protein [Gilbertella persicaria]
MTSIEAYVDQIADLDQQAIAPNAQLDTVLLCLSKPLEWLGYNESLLAISLPQQLALVQHPSWKKHVWHVLKNLVPQWTFALRSPTHRHLLEATHACSQDKIKAIMARVSLPIVLECLSTQENASLDTLEMYAALLKLLSLSSQLFPLYGKYINLSDIRFFCSLLCSIPGHLANAFAIQFNQVRFHVEHEWYMDRNFYAKLSSRMAKHLTKETIPFTQELLGKITRQGYEDIAIYTIIQSKPDHWSVVFEQAELIAPPEQMTKSILHYAHDHMPMINTASQQLAQLLFQHESKRKEQRLQSFLNTAVFKLSKCSWADKTMARISVCTVIYALEDTSLAKEEKQLSTKTLLFLIHFLKRVIQTWSDPVFIKHASFRERSFMTTVLLSFVAYLPHHELKQTTMVETSLFHSVSTWFNSGDIQTAQLGAVVAEAISSKLDTEKPLNTGLLDDNDHLRELKGLVFVTDAFDDQEPVASSTALDSESESELEEKDELDPDADVILEEDEDEEFEPYYMEEESEDEGLRKESTLKSTKKPVFVRDLIRYLQDKNDPLKLEAGLTASEQVIRRKIGAGTELSESSITLAKYLIGFPETYEIHDFRKLQQNALTALMVGVPETVTEFIIDQIYDRNTSTGQKQMILGAISLAVRELAGWTDNNTTKPINGKQTFLSKRMEIEKRNQHKIQKNRLSGLAGPVFFFPLLVGWWEGSQGYLAYWMGSNPVLTERFIMTLNIILHSSTNTLDKRRIVKEYFEFALSMRYAVNLSFGVKKALLLGIETIINISYKGQESLLFTDYAKELVETKAWLEAIIENHSEDKLQEMAVAVLIKISHIALTGQGTK